jgi:hypothetical protein
MTIETKYSPGDQVWLMFNNNPKQKTISNINILCYKKGSNSADMNSEYTIMYTIYGVPNDLPENKVFSTKEELINSL